jgi:signal transduction histidine kinase
VAHNDTITDPLGSARSIITREPASPTAPSSGARPAPRGSDQRAWVLAAITASITVGLALLTLLLNDALLAVSSEAAQLGIEAAAALASLFGALVLSLLPADNVGQRLHWIAAGFVILSLGGLVFGYMPPTLGIMPEINTRMYAANIVRTVAGTLFVVGLVLQPPPAFSRRWMLLAIAALGVTTLLTTSNLHLLPALAMETSLPSEQAGGAVLTGWHWTLSLIPLSLTIAAVAGTAYHSDGSTLSRLLVVAMTLLAGAQLHHLLIPSTYSPVLTLADLLRVAFAVVVSIGGMIELRRVATERTTLLAAEQEHSRRLVELAVLKADFTAMVAHELANPLAAIRGYADMLGVRDLSPEDQAYALAAIRTETNTLIALVSDIRIAASVERDDFAVRLVPVPTSVLIADAVAFGKTLPGDHPILTRIDSHAMVLADAERIGQVLRNLLTNAARYSADGSPIELRVTKKGTRISMAVADQGTGISESDLIRIFTKFGRGRDTAGKNIPGTGLGLYLSRRIVRAHGSDITVETTPDIGSVFAFELEAA